MIPTMLAMLYPPLALNPDAIPRTFDPKSFNFNWTRDPLSGFLDVVRPVEETLNSHSGDCDDAAFLVASWAEKEGMEWELGILFNTVLPRHMVVVTEDFVYSNTTSMRVDFEEYVKNSRYNWGFKR